MLAAADGGGELYSLHHQAFGTSSRLEEELNNNIVPNNTSSASNYDKTAAVAAASHKIKMNNKRRFSDEQIKSLESIFENKSKLEPRKKVQVARELGLQPRQVAIWFQNKRARWKSKQLEIDHGILRASYNALATRFDNLRKEKQSLVEQLEKLKKDQDHQSQQDGGASTPNKTIANNDRESGSNKGGSATNNMTHDRSSDEEEEEEEVKSGILLTAMDNSHEYELGMAPNAVLSDDGCSEINVQGSNYFVMDEEMDLLTMVEPARSSLTSDDDWHSLQSDGLFDQSASSCEWWDFWS